MIVPSQFAPTIICRPSSLVLLAGLVGLSLSGLSLVGHAQSPIGVQEPAWSPDGKRIAVSYLDRLWTMTPDGKQARAVVQDLKTSGPQGVSASLIEREPAWSPDGSRLAFAADKGNGFDVFVVPIRNGVAGGQPVAVTTMAGDERWPSGRRGRSCSASDARPSGRNGDRAAYYLYLSSPVSAPMVAIAAGSDRDQRSGPIRACLPTAQVASGSARDSETIRSW